MPEILQPSRETRTEAIVTPEFNFQRPASGKCGEVGQRSSAGQLFRKAKNMRKAEKKIVIDYTMKIKN